MTPADRLCKACVTEGCLQPSSPLVECRADLCDCCGCAHQFFVNAGPTATPAEELAVVRARLEHVIFLAGAATPGPWTQKNSADIVTGSDARWKVSVAWGVRVDAAFIAAASPDLLLRVARKDLEILNDHAPEPLGRVMSCKGEHGNYSHSNEWPCPEVDAVLRAWQP